MRNMIKTELGKATRNFWFLVALLVGCALALTSAINNVNVFEETLIGAAYLGEHKWWDMSSSSVFKYWIVTDFIQPATFLFFLLLPLLAVLPYAWSYGVEKKSGYALNVLARTSRKSYLFAKFLAVFISGGLVITIPIVLNFVFLACIMPARLPDIYGIIFFGINERSLFSSFFYTNPLVYCLLFIGLNFFFAGLWAMFTSALSFYLKNRVVVTIAPFLFLLFVKFLHDNVLLGILRTEITPFAFLRGTGTNYSADIAIVSLILLFLLGFTLVLAWQNRKKDIL
ncbi:MAG: hypothetical protein LBG81_06630 [Coriobacteriaceae bacterium]|nr:hypothetical protein [Coriobacteriaceae bacterium]